MARRFRRAVVWSTYSVFCPTGKTVDSFETRHGPGSGQNAANFVVRKI
jgi:hypothetical protein